MRVFTMLHAELDDESNIEVLRATAKQMLRSGKLLYKKHVKRSKREENARRRMKQSGLSPKDATAHEIKTPLWKKIETDVLKRRALNARKGAKLVDDSKLNYSAFTAMRKELGEHGTKEKRVTGQTVIPSASSVQRVNADLDAYVAQKGLMCAGEGEMWHADHGKIMPSTFDIYGYQAAYDASPNSGAWRRPGSDPDAPIPMMIGCAADELPCETGVGGTGLMAMAIHHCDPPSKNAREVAADGRARPARRALPHEAEEAQARREGPRRDGLRHGVLRGRRRRRPTTTTPAEHDDDFEGMYQAEPNEEGDACTVLAAGKLKTKRDEVGKNLGPMVETLLAEEERRRLEHAHLLLLHAGQGLAVLAEQGRGGGIVRKLEIKLRSDAKLETIESAIRAKCDCLTVRGADVPSNKRHANRAPDKDVPERAPMGGVGPGGAAKPTTPEAWKQLRDAHRAPRRRGACYTSSFLQELIFVLHIVNTKSWETDPSMPATFQGHADAMGKLMNEGQERFNGRLTGRKKRHSQNGGACNRGAELQPLRDASSTRPRSAGERSAATPPPRAGPAAAARPTRRAAEVHRANRRDSDSDSESDDEDFDAELDDSSDDFESEPEDSYRPRRSTT
ncbi:hypothetical protein JL720_15201 [Aureococcus anophagefferens]|nr:hypothetical protein JL720_15201 [Aureococcus anophagefferens]